jgi:tetratricopeptide (TPR) repeat protein
MKKILQTKFVLIALLSAALVVIGVAYVDLKDKQVPPLLERKGALSLSGEWKNAKKAIESLQAKIRHNPADYASKLMLAYGYMQEARITGEHPYYYPASLTLLEDVLDNVKKTEALYAKALVAKASVQLSLHHFAEALETGQEALAYAPADKDLYGVLCDANVELGNYPEAIKMADKMVELRPELASYSRISYLREIHGDLPGAIVAMQLAVESGYPGLEQTCWTRYNLAKLYERTSDTSMARQEYELIMAQNPHYAFAVGGLGGLAVKAKHYNQALGYYKQALDMMPEFSFQEEIARIYTLTHNPRAAEATKATLAMLEEDADAGHDTDLEVANLHLSITQEYDAALQAAEREYERRPANLDVNRALALIHYKLGHTSAYKKYAAAALRTHKQDPELQAIARL